MAERADLRVAIDVRSGRTVLATVRGTELIDTRRLEHAGPPSPQVLADAVAVLRERAPGEIAAIGAVWRHQGHVAMAEAAPLREVLAAVQGLTGLACHLLPFGAALALGEWLRAPSPGPLAVLTLDVAVAGGVVIDGAPFMPHRLDLGHLSVAADGPKCRCGGRGCLDALASERAIVALSRDLDLSLEAPSDDDWQTLMVSHLAELERESVRQTVVLVEHAGRAIGLAAAQLAGVLGVTEVRLRTRHPATWRSLQPAAEHALRAACGPLLPRLVPAHASEDAFFVGAVRHF